MRKADELADPNSCFNRAKDDEIVFVLLARDVAAPAAVVEWALERCRRGKNRIIDDQIIEALQCAVKMGKQREQNERTRQTYAPGAVV
jgi:hypothetical protein